MGVAGKFLMDRQNSNPQMYYVDYTQPPQFSNYDQYQQPPQILNYDQYPQYQQQPLLQPSIPQLPPAVNLNIQPVVPTNGQNSNGPPWTM
jgi:hypothetical protein